MATIGDKQIENDEVLYMAFKMNSDTWESIDVPTTIDDDSVDSVSESSNVLN